MQGKYVVVWAWHGGSWVCLSRSTHAGPTAHLCVLICASTVPRPHKSAAACTGPSNKTCMAVRTLPSDGWRYHMGQAGAQHRPMVHVCTWHCMVCAWWHGVVDAMVHGAVFAYLLCGACIACPTIPSTRVCLWGSRFQGSRLWVVRSSHSSCIYLGAVALRCRRSTVHYANHQRGSESGLKSGRDE